MANQRGEHRSVQSITSLEESPEADRRRRMVRYTIAMTIRVICIVLAMVVQGWLMWVFFAGAIFLPYFAVVLANNAGARGKRSLSKAEAPTLVITADSFQSSAKKSKRK